VKRKIGSYAEMIGIMMVLLLAGVMVFSPTVTSESKSTRNGEISLESQGINSYDDFKFLINEMNEFFWTYEIYVEIFKDGEVKYGGPDFTFDDLETSWYYGMDDEVGFEDDDYDGTASLNDIIYVDMNDEWINGQLRLRNASSDELLCSYDLTIEDTDSDGLPDYWEQRYFEDLSEDAEDDYDGDDSANLNEYLSKTDPTDEYDYPTNTIRGNVTNINTGDSIEGVEVIIYNMNNSMIDYDYTYSNGYYSMNYIKDGTYYIKATESYYGSSYYPLETDPFTLSGGEVFTKDLALTPVDIYIDSIDLSDPTYSGNTYTPGETIIIAISGTADKVIKVNIELNDNIEKTYTNQKLEGGLLTLAYTVPLEAPDGIYYIRCYPQGIDYPCGGYYEEDFAVRFMSLDLVLNRWAYLPGEQVLIYYSVEKIMDGTVVSTVSGEWELYEEVWDSEEYEYIKETLDKGKFTNGVGSISTRLKHDLDVGSYTVLFKANDTKDEHSAVTYDEIDVGNMNVAVSTNAYVFLPGEYITVTTSVGVTGGYYYSSPVEDASVDVTISIYDEDTDKWEYINNLEKKGLPTNARGFTTCVLQLPANLKEGNYRVEAAVKKYDVEVSATRSFRLQESARITLLLEFDKDSYVSGEEATLTCKPIFSTGDSTNLNYKYKVDDSSTGRIYDSTTSTADTYLFKIPANFVGTLNFQATVTTDDGYQVSNSKSISVRYGDLEINVNKMEYQAQDNIDVSINIYHVPSGNFKAYYQIFDENDDFYLGGSIPLTTSSGKFSFQVPETPSEEYDIKVIVVNDKGFTLSDTVNIDKISGYELVLTSDKSAHEPGEKVQLKWSLTNRGGRAIEGVRTLEYSIREMNDENEVIVYEGRISSIGTSGEFYFTIPESATDGTEYIINLGSREENGYDSAYTTYFISVEDPSFVETIYSSFFYFFGVSIALILGIISLISILKSKKKGKKAKPKKKEKAKKKSGDKTPKSHIKSQGGPQRPQAPPQRLDQRPYPETQQAQPHMPQGRDVGRGHSRPPQGRDVRWDAPPPSSQAPGGGWGQGYPAQPPRPHNRRDEYNDFEWD